MGLSEYPTYVRIVLCWCHCIETVSKERFHYQTECSSSTGCRKVEMINCLSTQTTQTSWSTLTACVSTHTHSRGVAEDINYYTKTESGV